MLLQVPLYDNNVHVVREQSLQRGLEMGISRYTMLHAVCDISSLQSSSNNPIKVTSSGSSLTGANRKKYTKILV